jgi:PIN domain nuclease of toxin-antitoxin system
MRVLLDTHAFLWYVLDDPQLSAAARAAIEGGANDPAPEVLVSPASYWEIAIKASLGKYELTVPYETFWRSGIKENNFRVQPIEIRHTAALLTMPYHHKDPFDRLLVATAMVEDIPLVSNDSTLDAYAINRIW